MRALTRPEGREAVDSVQVSGTWVCRAGSVNQAWNWAVGDADREEAERVPILNCAARDGVLVVVSWDGDGEVVGAPGAKISLFVGVGLCAWSVGDEWWSCGGLFGCSMVVVEVWYAERDGSAVARLRRGLGWNLCMKGCYCVARELSCCSYRIA
jgi:hypothetical protein